MNSSIEFILVCYWVYAFWVTTSEISNISLYYPWICNHHCWHKFLRCFGYLAIFYPFLGCLNICGLGTTVDVEMDTRHLLPDELEYEMAIRGVPASLSGRVNQLQNLLVAESMGTATRPNGSQRFTRNSTENEVGVCNNKLTQIDVAYEAAMQMCDEQQMSVLYSRLIHLKDRVSRLQEYAHNNLAVAQLVERFNRFMTEFHTSASSMGAGEAMQEREDSVEPPVEENQRSQLQSGGAIRKELQAPGARPIERRTATSDPRISDTSMPSRMQSQFSSQDLNARAPPFVPNRSASASGCIPSVQQLFNDPAVAGIRADRGQGISQFFDVPPRPAVQHGGVARLAGHAEDVGQARHGDHGRGDERGIQGGFRIAKWPLRFSGSPGDLSIEEFLFRVEKLARLDGVSEAALVIGIGVLLTDRAGQWFWTFQRKVENPTWDELRQALIRRYAPMRETNHDIRAKIEARKQRIGERFSDFCQDIEALAIRLTRRMAEDELVETLRRNMLMPLKKVLWRTRIRTVDELIVACSEFEHLCEEEERQIRYAQRRQARINEIAEAPLDDEWVSRRPQHEGFGGDVHVEAIQQGMSRADQTICWNCKDIGHVFTQCRVPQKHRFCYSCGMSNVLKADCPKCSGNAPRDGAMTGSSRPLPPPQIQLVRRSQPESNGNPFK